ncbi:hypothetical protein KSP39_PZI017888 [Platanthera zijinensis]|uniref:Uncharacterized protein n=1 Tax=Platanthera zijinensis TaxID=2320716 RepID=A0AAP0B5H3_9ASPA
MASQDGHGDEWRRDGGKETVKVQANHKLASAKEMIGDTYIYIYLYRCFLPWLMTSATFVLCPYFYKGFVKVYNYHKLMYVHRISTLEHDHDVCTFILDLYVYMYSL